MEEALIQYKNVEIHQQELCVLSGVNLELHKGEFVYLIGKVGSGKTHGLGVKNIAETAEKYNGSLDNSFKDGCFSSIVMLQNE